MKNDAKVVNNKISVPSFPGTGLSFFDFLSFNTNLPRKIRGYDIDVIHSQGDHGFALTLIKKRPLVVTVHTSMKIGLRAVPRLRYHFSPYFRVLTEKYTFMKADKIIVVSQSLTKSLQEDFGIEKEKIVYIPNAVDIEKFNPSLNGEAIRKKFDVNGPLLVCVTRLDTGRFVEKLIPMVKTVKKEIPNIKLIIVGDGPSKRSLKRQRDRYSLTKNVILAGAKGDKELPYFYAAADLCVLPMVYTPARKEFSVLEAMASGKVVVYVNRMRPMNDVERLCIGNPIAAKDDEDFANLIIYLLQNEKKRKRLGLLARKAIVKNFSWEKVAEKTLEVYKLLICAY
jgi:glycosyltransferase involved in cell wall biosynthesis